MKKNKNRAMTLNSKKISLKIRMKILRTIKITYFSLKLNKCKLHLMLIRLKYKNILLMKQTIHHLIGIIPSNKKKQTLWNHKFLINIKNRLNWFKTSHTMSSNNLTIKKKQRDPVKMNKSNNQLILNLIIKNQFLVCLQNRKELRINIRQVWALSLGKVSKYLMSLLRK